jgi:hypothetical protein
MPLSAASGGQETTRVSTVSDALILTAVLTETMGPPSGAHYSALQSFAPSHELSFRIGGVGRLPSSTPESGRSSIELIGSGVECSRSSSQNTINELSTEWARTSSELFGLEPYF